MSTITVPSSPEATQRLFARLFAGEDGAQGLAYLRALTLDRAMGAHVSSEQLWHLEGQRYLARHILKLVESGTPVRARTPAEMIFAALAQQVG